ncbi:MAG TPA: hypothetical protein VEI48_05770 [Candidatus Sulfotelmatobacter sp.]|nr:hypothetical protein [Candidatus Sulfotelmatobacter sp.]
MRARSGLLGCLAAGIVGCSAVGGPGIALPVIQPTAPPGVHELCPLALHTPFTLEGDASQSPPVWGVDRAGATFDIFWPPGFTARFSPDLEVLDPSGRVVERGGLVTDLGGGGDPNSGSFDVCSVGAANY